MNWRASYEDKKYISINRATCVNVNWVFIYNHNTISDEVSSSNISAIIKLADDTVVTGNVVNYYTASSDVVVVTLDSGETYQVSWLNCTIIDRVK